MHNNTSTESNKMIILSIIIDKNMIRTNVITFIKVIVIINYNLTCSIIVCILDLHIYIIDFSHDNNIYNYMLNDKITSLFTYQIKEYLQI